MFHLHPVQPSKASGEIQKLYQDIQEVFQIHTVPVLFQYLANYEHYLQFIWERMKINLASTSFSQSCQEIETFSRKIISQIYTPSPMMKNFLATIPLQETRQIRKDVQLLQKTNIKLLLLLIDLREGMKTIFIGTERLSRSGEHHDPLHTDASLSRDDEYLQRNKVHDIRSTTHALLPLFNKEIAVSYYSDFFTTVSLEVEKLQNTETYLQSRVSLEHLGLTLITRFEQALGCSYKEFMQLTQDKPYINELLNMVTDFFPSLFPHSVLTSALILSLLPDIQE